MDVYVQSTIGICTEFVAAGKRQEISVVISPLKVISEENTLKVSSGCSMWRACQNHGCQFGLIAHGGERKAKGVT